MTTCEPNTNEDPEALLPPQSPENLLIDAKESPSTNLGLKTEATVIRPPADSRRQGEGQAADNSRFRK